MDYRPDIDGLRTVAVIPVVIFHAGLGLDGGYVGVDVFFVISGYLITDMLLSDLKLGRFSVLNFYERRARRIFPALFLMILLTSFAASFLMMPFDLAPYGESAIAATAFFANIWFYSQGGYFTEAPELKPLLHTWSLGIEEQFYLAFPIVLWLSSRRLRTKGTFLLLTMLVLASLVASFVAVQNDSNAAFYLPQYRAWEMLVGSVLAIAMSQDWLGGLARDRFTACSLAIIGIAAIATAAAVYGPETSFPGPAALLPCLGAGLLIVTGGYVKTPVAHILAWPPMVFIGRLSYSLYLWHWPVIAFTYYVNGDLAVPQGLVCTAVSLALAYLSWRFVEQPFRNRSYGTGRRIFGGSVAVMAVIIGFGVLLERTDGLPGRFPGEVYTLGKLDAHMHPWRHCHFVNVERARRGDVCLRGEASAEPSFALVGDSHADAFSPALFAAAKDLGLSGYHYTAPGFRPLVGVSRSGGAGSQEPIEAFIEFLEARLEIRTIFLTGYWLHQMTGHSYRHEGHIWRDIGYDGSGSDYNKVATLNGLRRLAERLPSRRIVLLDDVPSGEALHIAAQLRFSRFGHPMADGLPRSESDKQRLTYEPFFLDLAAQHEAILYYPVFAELCDSTLCPLFDGDTLLFRDGDHLSYKGAMRLSEKAKELLRLTLSHPR